ncbi:MAG: hypothetical protein H7Z15_21230 [Rhizobacter sp.]|nr:hypothetical protein [Rhizobacter sp.]
MHFLPIRKTPPLCAGNPENGALILGMDGVFLEQKDNTKGHYIWGLRGHQALQIAYYPSVTMPLANALKRTQPERAPSRHVRRFCAGGRGTQADLKRQSARTVGQREVVQAKR